MCPIYVYTFLYYVYLITELENSYAYSDQLLIHKDLSRRLFVHFNIL